MYWITSGSGSTRITTESLAELDLLGGLVVSGDGYSCDSFVVVPVEVVCEVSVALEGAVYSNDAFFSE